MSPRLNHKELAELKARHLASSHLIKGCQDAVIRLRRDRAAELRASGHHLGVEYRSIQILEEVLDSWCETLTVLRASLSQDTLAERAVWSELSRQTGALPDKVISKSAGRPKL